MEDRVACVNAHQELCRGLHQDLHRGTEPRDWTGGLNRDCASVRAKVRTAAAGAPEVARSPGKTLSSEKNLRRPNDSTSP